MKTIEELERENAELINKVDRLTNDNSITHERFRDAVTENEQLRADVAVQREALKNLWNVAEHTGDRCMITHALSTHPGTELFKELEELRKDKELWDWVEKQSDGSSCVARQSNTGRGFRLHNTGSDSSHWPLARSTFREAIKARIKSEEEPA